jgi:hypothetical protein
MNAFEIKSLFMIKKKRKIKKENKTTILSDSSIHKENRMQLRGADRPYFDYSLRGRDGST